MPMGNSNGLNFGAFSITEVINRYKVNQYVLA